MNLACHVHLTVFGDVFQSQKYQQTWRTIMELLTQVRRADKQISTSPGGFTQWAGRIIFSIRLKIYPINFSNLVELIICYL